MLDEFEAYLLKYGDKALKRMGTERYSRQRQAFRCQRRRENASTGRSKTAPRMGFRDAERCLTKRAPLPQLILRPSPSSPSEF